MLQFTSESSIWPLFLSKGSCPHHTQCIQHGSWLFTYLYRSSSSWGAGSDLEQPCFCRCGLATSPRGSTLVNNQGLSTKHTHQVRWLFSLHYSFLEKIKIRIIKKKTTLSFKLLLKSSIRYARKGFCHHTSSQKSSYSIQMVIGT